MLKFKRIILFILIVGVVCSLAACESSYYLYNNTDGSNMFLKKGVISIELIKYTNSAAQNDPLRKYDFNLSLLEILEALEVEDITKFLTELSNNGGRARPKQVLKSPVGTGIRIVYDDSSFTLITVMVVQGKDRLFLGEYDGNEKIGWNFGISWQDMIDDFKALTNESFSTQIDWPK